MSGEDARFESPPPPLPPPLLARADEGERDLVDVPLEERFFDGDVEEDADFFGEHPLDDDVIEVPSLALVFDVDFSGWSSLSLFSRFSRSPSLSSSSSSSLNLFSCSLIFFISFSSSSSSAASTLSVLTLTSFFEVTTTTMGSPVKSTLPGNLWPQASAMCVRNKLTIRLKAVLSQ